MHLFKHVVRREVLVAVGLALVALLAWFFMGKDSSARMRVNIEETQNIPQCITFNGHGITPEGDLYLLGVDGYQYDMPLTEAIQNANPNAYPTLEATAANMIENKFCLADGSIEVDIEGGKYVNITVNNIGGDL